MARLIPSFVDDRTPSGERDVFNMLAGGPSDWAVMHSLDLAPWNKNLRTEIDFVVIVPDAGILCIEVKSHQIISFDGQRWTPSEIKRSPFKQAADGRFAFYRRFRDMIPRLSRVPVVHCCIFPGAPFDLQPNMSVAEHELMDSRVFVSFKSSEAFCVDLRTRIHCSIDRDATLHRMTASLSSTDVDAIISACVPVQKRRPGAREEIRRREEEAEAHLRKQQQPVLTLAQLNDRVRVSGGAGTGKTLIAMEAARRAADRGLRTALLCFNQLVGDWMRHKMEEAAPLPPNLVVGRAIQVMATMTGVSIPNTPSASFWNTELPLLIEDRLTDPELGSAAGFDYIVLDEAQDLLARPRLMSCLGQLLHGGIKSGSFLLLGDFDHQVLAEHATMQSALRALDEAAQPVRWHLSENCRNYRIVGETAVRLGGIGALVYSGYLRHGGSHQNYDIAFYRDAAEQLGTLRKWLREFKELGYSASEVTLLSFRDDASCAAHQLTSGGHALRPAWKPGTGSPYATVHAFKGMENKVIILTDVSIANQRFHRDLFYTGMTRATECVRVLCDKASEEVLCDWLAERRQCE
jgi:hypothetical protein